MYKLRAKVVIEPRDQLAALAEWNGDHARYAIAYPDPRLPALGVRAIIAKGEMRTDVLTAARYHAHRLALGVPEGVDFGSDKMFALDADFDELHGVDFGKGCYIGQELTARMKHRGTARKRLVPVTGATALPAAAPVKAGERDVGEIASVYGQTGFALVRLDRLDEPVPRPLTAGDSIAVELSKPSWLSA